MILSIVSGTYNRLTLLQNMMRSVRQQLPVGLAYEFVIADAGSTDGTLEWLREQPDVVLIEDGERRGAINAFTRAAYLATGKYVLLANDDITLWPGSLLRAVVHLEEMPACGAVAFADDRPSPYKVGHAVMEISAVHTNNQQRGVKYAQVGLFRKWLGDEIGWWDGKGAMTDSRTYGGDAYLSAKIWELGYTVDEVFGAAVDDHVADDDLRAENRPHGATDSNVFRRHYPNGVRVSSAPLLPQQDKKQLRVLYLPVYERGHAVQKAQKRGLRDALAKKYLVYELDYLASDNLRADLLDALNTFQPRLLLMQTHGADRVTPDMLMEIRSLYPKLVIVNWNGDYWLHGLTAPPVLAQLRHVDLQLVVNADVLATYEQNQIPAAYWQIGYEEAPEPLPDVQSHDVVFLGTARTPQRQTLGALLKSLDGVNVGLYGGGWPDAQGECMYDFATGAALYQNAKLSIGDNEFPDATAFVSNRLFQALAAGGALLLHQRVKGLAELTGITPGVHYIEWTDAEDLRAKITYWLDPTRSRKRKAIAQAGCDYVREHHSFAARVRQLVELLPLARRPLNQARTLEYVGRLNEGGVKGRITGIQYTFRKGQPLLVDAHDAPYMLHDATLWREHGGE